MKERKPYRCDGVTRSARMCKRPASVHYVKKDGTCVKHYCPGHASGSGVMKMLLPLSFEYDHVERYAA